MWALAWAMTLGTKAPQNEISVLTVRCADYAVAF